MRNRALVLWILVIVAMTLLAGCGAAGGGGTNVSVNDVGNVEGTVTDATTGLPVSGVTVQVGDKSNVTGANGVYSIQDLAVGSRTATATKSGYQNYNGTMTVTKGTTVTQNIQMTLTGAGDTTPPTVSSTDPANKATAVAVNKVITVTFSEAMDCSTITTSTVTLKDSSNNAATGTITTCNNTSAVFTPSSSLTYSTTYTATITTGVKDAAGNAMAGYSWNFTTGGYTITFLGQNCPSSGCIYMAKNDSLSSDSTLAIDVRASNISSSVYGAVFDFDFDSSKITYDGYTAGNFFENGGNPAIYSVNLVSGNSGKLVVGISRQGSASGVSGSGTFVTLKFKVTGSSSVAFSNNALRDSSNQTITGVTWSGGTVTTTQPAGSTISMPADVTVTGGVQYTVRAMVQDPNGYPMNGVAVNFVSSNSSVASFSPTSAVNQSNASTNSSGIATITVYTFSGVTGAADITGDILVAAKSMKLTVQ